MSYIKDVWNGWKNVLFASPEIEQLAEKRKVICDRCPTKSKRNFCSKKKGGCGCPLLSILRSPEYKCIRGKW